MNRDFYHTQCERFNLLVELVKSLNKGDSGCYEDRVSVAKKQLNKLDLAWKEMLEEEVEEQNAEN